MSSQARDRVPPWGPEKKLKWFLDQKVQRSYREEVLQPIEALRTSGRGLSLIVESYGSLTIDPDRFPLYAARTEDTSHAKPTVLITGGVHGYETSGVKGALLFLKEHLWSYADDFHFVVAPCVSPWSYETINRLDPIMENPNREFTQEGKAEESRLLMAYLNSLGTQFAGHIDLYETTDSDRVFLPEEYSKNGLVLDAEDIDIPDGFYLIGIDGFARPELEKKMLDAVRRVTHIAPVDEKGEILDVPVAFEGMIYKGIRGLCAEFTNAKSELGAYTTEMYPDSPQFKNLTTQQVEDICNEAQVVCVRAALDFWRS